MARVLLKPGHVRPVYSGHPWVFRQAIGKIEGNPAAGDEVTVVEPQGRVLGRGFFSHSSAIPVRLFTHEDRAVDASLFRERLQRALQHRAELGLPNAETDAFRLVHGEGDGLPGLIVDVFGDVVAVQLNTSGVKQREGLVFDLLSELLRPRAIIDRTSESAARMENVASGSGVVRGDTALASLRFRELGFEFDLPLSLGQKTGYYLDQRALRARVERLAKGRSVLDAYAFVGSFGLAALRGGATRVRIVDQSAIAVELAAETARKNGLHERAEVVKMDAVRAMEEAANHGTFDLVLCDPPKLAPSRAKLEVALAGYRKVARAACRATTPGGLLVLSSCSSAVPIHELVRALAHGARDANLQATVLEQHIQAADHPVPAAFPEGLYLKSLVARIDLART